MPEGHALLSITHRCINRGNLIIEHAARRVLGLESPAVVIDAHQPLERWAAEAASACRATVLPGATLLQPGDHPAVERLDWITSPKIVIGAALRSLDGTADLAVARAVGAVETPVGSRDPFTHDALTQAGIPSRLVGCPTLLLGDAQGWKSPPSESPGPIVFAAGLGNQGIVAECAKACAEAGPVVELLHAPERQPPFLAGPGVEAVPLASAEQAFAVIRSARVVVTSRMHAFLSALIFGVPAFFLGGWYDSRYSLLEYLGVPIEPPTPERVRALLAGLERGRLPAAACFEQAETLRAGMRAWLAEIREPAGLPESPTLAAVEA
jgi:hypothetical protein